MSLRSKLKVPHYGLFYFEVDKTVSVVPLKKIRKVFKGDNTSKGSVVEIFYAGVLLKAEIIAVDDDEKKLDQLSYAFLSDPNNAHLFPRNSSDEEDTEVPEVAPPVDKANKSISLPKKHTQAPSKKRKTDDTQLSLPKKHTQAPNKKRKADDTQHLQKGKGSKNKPEAAVVARFAPPSSSSATNLAVQRSSLLCTAISSQPMAPDQSAAKLHTLPSAQPEILQESPSLHRGAVCGQSVVPVTASPASLHPTPLLVPEPPSAAQVTHMPAHNQAHKPSAPRPSSPASSLHSSPAVSLPSNSPWSPPPLHHKSAHTRVYRRPALQPSSPASSLQSSPAVSLNNSSWSPPPLRHRQRDSHVARHLFRESSAFNLPPELWLFLQNLDRRLERLTNNVDEIKSNLVSDLHSHSAAAPVPHRNTSAHLPVQTQYSLNASTRNSYQMPELETSPIPQEQDPVLKQLPATPVLANGIPYERLMVIRSEASSIMNFAVRILREICPAQELVGKNISGARGKQAVDPNKVEQIRELIKKYYPAPPSETERNWRECRKAMDSFLRKLPK